MSTQIQNTIAEEPKKRIYTNRTPSEKEEAVVKNTFNKFTRYADNRNQNLNNFDGLNIVQYIEESYRRYTTNIDVREDIEDWQSVVHDPITRNKVNAVLSKVVAVLPISQIQPRGDEDPIKASLLNEIYEYAEDVDDYDEFMVRYLLEAIVKGTAIGFEGHTIKNKKVRKIVSGDGDSIKVEEAVIKESLLNADIIPLEDFYPANIGIPNLKKMGSCFVRKVIPHDLFLSEYSSMFSRAEYVEPCNTTQRFSESVPYYYDYISNDISDGNVEMLFYYDENNDEYIVIANGIWLNPIGTISKDAENNVTEGEEISPLPYNHKKLPFFDLRFELFSADFFFGKSLPDKLKTLQDVLNVLENMLNDQSFLSIFQPILTAGFDSIEDDFLRPGRRTAIDTGGLPIQQSVMKLDMGTPGGWHQFILDYTKRVMEEASIDKVSQGVAGAGDRVTAKEISVAAEGVSSLLGLFGRWVDYACKRKAELKIKNALQFWTDKDTATLEGILGGGGSKVFQKAFRTFKIDGATLTEGKRGTKVIGLFHDKSEIPTKAEVKAQSMAFELINNKKIEYVAIPFDYFKDIDFDIKYTTNRKTAYTRDMDKAIMMEKVRVYKSFFPNLTNDAELFAQLAEKMGDDPTKIMNQDAVNSELGIKPEETQDNNPEALSQNPEGDIMKNAMYKSMGNQVGIQNIKQMLG